MLSVVGWPLSQSPNSGGMSVSSSSGEGEDGIERSENDMAAWCFLISLYYIFCGFYKAARVLSQGHLI